MTKTQTQSSPKCETPFAAPVWEWNRIPTAGIPTRIRAQSVVTANEAKAGAELIGAYRLQERIATDNDIEGRQLWLDREQRVRMVTGVEMQKMRAEMASCDHGKFLDAQEKLRELRETAFRLVEPIFRRLIQSYDSELIETARDAEHRLDKAGLPIRNGNSWLLHSDVTSLALWSCRHAAERTYAEIQTHRDGIGCVQYFCTDESGVPFTWI
jgi:hypothetical protein